ncbi:endo-1,4-beta-xylanase [Belliella sp. R4-6]|uniref:Endo-1,4-beta-xylanase n=1 Tax=Belliella alkalica TaxID=1730871 RepID=A0ABS9V7L8_9BACT|nr:endo-1,4-beta-xylanase [Belliella alkalica]MCH7412416.1 endo-1,4-beta-xylanase [Belliella alkalica]
MKRIINSILLSGFMGMTACADFEALDFQVEKPLSIENQEEINKYPDLVSYLDGIGNPEFRLGVSLPISDYLSRGVRYRLVNRNYNEFTPASGIDHRSIVQNNGSLNLLQVTSLLEEAGEKNIRIVPSPLIWHRNQNAGYLNGLLSPLIVNSPAFINELNISSLASGNLAEWSSTAGVSYESSGGMGTNTPAIKMIAGGSVSSPDDLRFSSPTIQVIPGKTYEVIAYIKSDQDSEGRFTFEGMNNNQPILSWTAGSAPSETFSTGISWKEIRFRVSDFEGDSFKFNLELGYTPNTTFFVDINNLYVYDIDGDPIVTNLIADGNFDSGIAWGGWGNNSTRGVTEEGMGVGNSGRAFFVTNPSVTGGFWEVQTLYQLSEPVKNGETYKLSFWIKGDAEGSIRPELQSPNFSSNGFGQVFVTTDWRFVTLTTTVTADDRNRFIVSYGEFAGTVYIDQVVLASESMSGGSTTIVEKTVTEKAAVVEDQMERWIRGFVSETKDHIKVREVISEPIHETNPSLIRTGVGANQGEGEFYWQDYIGKDYAAKAFKLARENGNADDILFISESGLETNLAKCEALKDYISYIDQNGGKVDGVSVRMILTLNSSTDNVAEVFRILATTGKMIRIGALEVRINAAQPTTVMLERQADIYKQVVEHYLNIVPTNLQYGITLSAPIDGTDQARAGLWNSNLVRKNAYAGFADGLDK